MAVRHAAYATSVALGTLILLLLAGSQILSWVWLAVLPALALAAGVYATWRDVPSRYRAAQVVDRNLSLADTLSTAVYFAEVNKSGDARRTQWAQAERLAATVDLRRAVPLQLPRAAYASAALVLLAGGLFALRYGLERRLDLRAPLASIIEDNLGYSASQEARARRPRDPHDPKQQKEHGDQQNEAIGHPPGELDAAPDAALDSPSVPNVDNSAAPNHAGDSKLGKSAGLESDENKGDQNDGSSTDAANQQSADGRQGSPSGKPGKQEGAQQGSGNPPENAGLLSKFRDAMSSLMNRMKPQQGAQSSGNQARQAGNQGQSGKQGQQQADARSASGQDAQPGDQNQDAQSAQSASAGQSGQQPATKQPGSGIGRQDGNKDVKLAEQLAAMGKISEIIGKRSANVTGDLTVETTNTSQQLRTPYARRDAHHSEAGGEINRDEVPVAYQAYVEQYFEQVRKQASAPKATAPGAKRRTETPKPGM